MSLMTVSPSPHIHAKSNTQKIMRDVIFALMPALVAASVIFGLRALFLTAVSAAACVLCEHLFCLISKKKTTVGDLSAVVTGILLSFNVPVGMPIWELIVGDVVAILLVKMLFGGIGFNFVNPALVGRVVMMFSFPSDMTNYATEVARLDALTSATPLSALHALNGSDFWTLFLGQHGGALGETCTLALLVGGLYLFIRRVITPTISVSYLASTLLFSWLFGGVAPLLSLFCGGLMLGAIFMATDYVTSPITEKGKLIYGIGCGLLTAAIRLFANATEGVSFAILLMNILVPYINDFSRNKPLGGVKTA